MVAYFDSMISKSTASIQKLQSYNIIRIGTQDTGYCLNNSCCSNVTVTLTHIGFVLPQTVPAQLDGRQFRLQLVQLPLQHAALVLQDAHAAGGRVVRVRRAAQLLRLHAQLLTESVYLLVVR